MIRPVLLASLSCGFLTTSTHGTQTELNLYKAQKMDITMNTKQDKLKLLDCFQVLWTHLSGFSNLKINRRKLVGFSIWKRKYGIADTCSCWQPGKVLLIFLLANIWGFLFLSNIQITGHVGMWTSFPLPLEKCGCSYLGLEALGCFGGPSSAGGTCADRSRAVADTDRSCCCLSGTGV